VKSVNELIASGKVPGDTKAADNQAGYPNGWPIFTDLANQVEYDWNNLPSDRVRSLKYQPEYKAALDTFLLEPAVPQDAPSAAPDVTLAASPEQAIVEGKKDDTTPTPAEPAAPAAAAPAAIVAPSEDDVAEGTKSGPYTKVKGGWEARVESVDGSGVQVYKGKTKDEVSEKLMTAQAHATAKIRQQEEEKQRLLADEPATLAPVRKRLAPRKMTADEQFEFAEAMSSGDPTKINRAMLKRDEIMLGGPVDEVIGQVNETRDTLEMESYRAVANTFVKRNSNVSNLGALGADIDNIIAEGNWAYTVRNLEKALAQLKLDGKVQYKVSTPAVEKELPVPTQSREVVPAPVAPAVSTAPAAAPTATKTNQPASTVPALQPGERMRPGSASTGVSPRQASVRQGSTPSTPVGLTAEEYNRMSVSETRRKYQTDLGFRSAVDKLIAEGKI
jgi:hypothetical protein